MKRLSILVLLLLMLFVSACGAAAPQSAAPASSDPAISVSGAWARPSPMMAGNGAVYMQLTNAGAADDALISASTSVAEVVELHESKMENDVMKMSPVEKIEVPAGGSASLEPGGLHVMLINLQEQLEPGKKIQLTLNFEKSGSMDIEADIREMGDMGGEMKMDGEMKMNGEGN